METSSQIKLIKAAAPLFARKGFASVSIRELAEAAKVNGALISYYFSSKEGLYSAVLEEQFIPIAQVMQVMVSMDHLSATERLNQYVQHIIMIHSQYPLLTRLLYSELTSPTDCGREIVNKYISQLSQLVQVILNDGIASGDFKPNLNLSYATAFSAGIINFYFILKPILKEFAMQSDQSDEKYFAQAIRIFLHGIIRRRENE
jgi:TetR/AcrR family transcriptional regulator